MSNEALNILISLLVTLAAYCAFPLIFASYRKKPITKKKIRFLCFLGNIIPLLFFIALNGSSSGAPYVIWTTVFAFFATKKLAARGLLSDGTDAASVQTESVKTGLSESIDVSSAPTETYGIHHVSGNDLILETTPEIHSDTHSSTAQVSKSAPIPASAPGKQRFCKYCGGAINPETKQCTSCGKQFFKPPKVSSGILIVTIVVLTAFLAIGGYFVSAYNKGLEAMENQQFILSKQYFDRIPGSKSRFASKYAYIEAGILMEEGKYLTAYYAFSSLEDTPVPVSIMNKLESEIYSIGLKNYYSGDYFSARNHFSAIGEYERSSDYALLASCHVSSLMAESKYDELYRLIDFEDASSIILNNSRLLQRFLDGRWEAGEENPYFFEIDVNENTSYNLPHYYKNRADEIISLAYLDSFKLLNENKKGTYHFDEGVYYVEEKNSSLAKIFKFSIIDKDSIFVYCFKDGSIHTLNCVKRHNASSTN